MEFLLSRDIVSKHSRIYHEGMVPWKWEVGMLGHLVRCNLSISQMVCEKRETWYWTEISIWKEPWNHKLKTHFFLYSSLKISLRKYYTNFIWSERSHIEVLIYNMQRLQQHIPHLLSPLLIGVLLILSYWVKRKKLILFSLIYLYISKFYKTSVEGGLVEFGNPLEKHAIKSQCHVCEIHHITWRWFSLWT